GYSFKRFGSGTRLIVTDTPVKEPQVSAFTMFKNEKYEKAVLLCQARGMFPDLVRFRWQAEDHNKQNVQLGSEERLEQRDEDPEVRITSMLIIDKQKAESKTFTCLVQHDSSVTDKKLSIPTDEDIRKAQKESMPDTSKAICPTQKPKEDKEEEEIMNFGVLALSRSLYLFSVTYVILLVKNVLYFCTVSVLLCMRNPANMEMIRGKGKGRELADMMERRKVDILCVQETRWKGRKACSIGAGFKLFYYGVDSKRNGLGVVLKEEFVRNVLEVKRVSDRVMSLKLEIEGVMLNVVSGYAPQVGCELEEKERFWSELDEVMESIPTGERVVIGADFNGHVGEWNRGDEEVMGKFGVKERNLEGQMVVDFAKRMDMAMVNTYFQKREEHRVTYKSGGRRTQVDYILCRRGNLKEISDCKVVVGESVARQHRMVVCRMTLMVYKKKKSKIEIEIDKKTKWWKLKKEECCEEFRQKLRQALDGQVLLPDDWETTAEVIRETGRKVLSVSSGRRKEDKETWWWNEEVQDSVQRKRLAKKKWDMDRTEENRQEYKELQRRVKREVSKAKQKAYDELYTRLDTGEGEKGLYRLARQRDRDGKDVQQVRVIKDRDGRVLPSEESVQRRWKEYFEELMNEENEREKRVEGVNSVEQKVDKIRKDEVRKALKRMKSGKAVGPDDIPVEVWKCLGEAAVEFLTSLFNRVLESERMPEEWRRSVLVPIFKNKGDVQSCSNYRGIKLMSHIMKLWERVVEARLRKVVEICEQQYGFMPRKSTTDAIFALRILMEKYRDGQRELHCVFVDLEKAYDRVPREELWYCMRKSGVAEKYVRVVQDMYERSRTVVRCAVGQTEEFKVEVGLHQGSALSPFLFAMVMDQLSEEVRQESPWTMMFADDIVICSESREQVEENLERWRFALERRGMKVSRSKTEYMCVNEREGSGTVRLQGEEVKKVQEFKFLGSTVQSNGECGKEAKKRVQADTPVKEPQVSAFTMFKTETYEKAVLLCQARGMFPDLVRFRWQAEDHNNQNVQLGSEERLEQRDEDPEVRITSMLIIDKQKAESKTFTCSVQHDSSVTDQKLSIPTDKDIRKTESKPGSSTNCSTQIAVEEEEEEKEIRNFGVLALSRSLYLFSVTYVILLVKNVLYFCTVSVLLCMRNPANMEMIRSKGH
ncbi:hypothetical protein QTP70_024471, partial [Hemibagrus guttatus]